MRLTGLLKVFRDPHNNQKMSFLGGTYEVFWTRAGDKEKKILPFGARKFLEKTADNEKPQLVKTLKQRVSNAFQIWEVLCCLVCWFFY